MLAKVFFVVAFATLGMAMPQHGGNNNNNGDPQQARVDDLRNKGLTCNDRGDGIFVCDDGFGGNCFVNQAGSGNCLI
ncbi:hypothetical protein FLAG1_10484 [Fusarium langsethiae]|uniref:Uncharacterized protein n=1 Tax=Fusarium langsethiae TaxID=179993 RepID=A0A0N0V534_FUSLA|nr:hypothetical protein FLAG1_10484 [Fusarium langsethiae]GKU07512.1 unnamed protein product [Fusarium langsethiae]GKU20019.1 unnamed protein product [Fusarium langsethiae]